MVVETAIYSVLRNQPLRAAVGETKDPKTLQKFVEVALEIERKRRRDVEEAAHGIRRTATLPQSAALSVSVGKVGIAGNDEIVSVFDTNPDLAISSWKVVWTTVRETAKVHCRFHDLRHTTVTRLLERGVAFAVVATIMGGVPRRAVAWRSDTDTSDHRCSATR